MPTVRLSAGRDTDIYKSILAGKQQWIPEHQRAAAWLAQAVPKMMVECYLFISAEEMALKL